MTAFSTGSAKQPANIEKVTAAELETRAGNKQRSKQKKKQNILKKYLFLSFSRSFESFQTQCSINCLGN